jgi:superfamily II DNA or RNA helicase
VDDSAIGQETNEPPLPQLDNSIEKPIELRTYQEDAIAAWVRAGGIGILEMATGTGKTVTALSAATQTLSERAGAVLVVVAPFIHLVDQWAQEMAAFGMYPVRCYGPTSAWRDSLDAEMDLVRLGVKQIAICVATHKALGNPALMDAVGRAGQGTVRMVVADEVHHLGAPKLFAPLDGFGFTLRLGLSATPQRWLDDVGNERLREYFGGTVFEFGLSEAIAGGFLTPYEYKPVIVELTQNEVASYGTLTRQIARLLESGATDIGPLLNRRAEILNAAEGKLGALRELVPQDKQHTHALFYSTPSRLQSVVELLMTHHRLRVHRFTYRESRAERQRLLAAFARGDIHALVAIRCLDEGVDVPGTRTAYLLASSGNPREFIQRRGRILRKAEGKDRAVIYDLITVPSYGRARTSSAWEMERGIVRRELQRFLEFADNALNPNDARGRLLPLQLQYELLDL